jgi:hypothetical protein
VSGPEVFIGGMNVPMRGGFGRVNATIPLASLSVDQQTLTLAPRWFARVFIRPLVVPLGEVEVAYRLRGQFMTSGVGFDTHDGRTVYFWTRSAQDEVLRALTRLGVTIDSTPRRATAQWRLR